MICPFRVNVRFEYDKGLERAQLQEYAECVGEECPFYKEHYRYGCECKRATAMVGDDE